MIINKNTSLIFFLIITISLSVAQEFKELLPPKNLEGNFSKNTVLLKWQAPPNWDSLKYYVFKAIIFDTSNIVTENLQFNNIETTKNTFTEEYYSDIKNLSHLAFMYCVVAKDTNDVESLRSNYCLVNIK